MIAGEYDDAMKGGRKSRLYGCPLLASQNRHVPVMPSIGRAWLASDFLIGTAEDDPDIRPRGKLGDCGVSPIFEGDPDKMVLVSRISPQSDVAIGQILADKYRVERVLGVGGMGVVVEATHLHLEKRVALKFMLGALAQANAEGVVRFMREGRAAAKLQSEHVARVMDVGRLESGEPYMVMEFLEGQDLSQFLDAQGPLPVEQAISFVLQACEAIAEAHSLGIVHRDLKPSNLFLSRRADGAALVKVLDFGISKVASVEGDRRASSDMTATRAMLGSPAYMSPEQVRSAKNVDARTDIWALGVILYELLTGQSPFRADSLPGLIAAIVSDPATPILTLRGDLPAPLSHAIMRCLDKDPSKRFESVAELAAALEPYAPNEGPLVAQIVRMQKSAGLTQLNTTRPPAPSMAGVEARSAPAEANATANTFGVTARPGNNHKLALLAGLLGIVAISGLASWGIARSLGGSVEFGEEEKATSALSAVADAAGEGSQGPEDAAEETLPEALAEPAGATASVESDIKRVVSKSEPRTSVKGITHEPGTSKSAGKPPANPPAPPKPTKEVDLSERR
jgi:serine/threonine-protein kinase